MAEQVVLTSRFGQITNRRLIVEQARTRRDIPLPSIATVESEKEKHPIIGVVFLFGAVAMPLQGGQWISVGIVSLVLAVPFMRGFLWVRITLFDGSKERFRAWPWQAGDVRLFVETLRGQLVASNSEDAKH